MIRFATNEDVNDIIKLWNEAFGDNEDDIRFFVENRFVPENTLVADFDNEVVSMLFLLEGSMVINDIDYPSYYLYAACTAEKSRGKGLMAALLSYAKSLAAKRNKYFICLMPGEKSLFDFYARFGYKSIFSRKILKINYSEINDSELSENKLYFPDYYDKRINAFSKFNRFEWDEHSIKFACKHHLLYSGNEQNKRNGYALYNVNADEVFVKEFAFSADDFLAETKNLFDLSECKKAVVILPVDYSTSVGEYEIVDSAMAVAVKPEFDSVISEIKNAYLGLTLD